MKTNEIQVVSVEEVTRHVNIIIEKAGSQRKAALEMGIGDPDLSNFLKGKKNPSGDMLEHLGLDVRKVYVKKAK